MKIEINIKLINSIVNQMASIPYDAPLHMQLETPTPRSTFLGIELFAKGQISVSLRC